MNSLIILCIMLLAPLCFSFGPRSTRMAVRALSMQADVIEAVKGKVSSTPVYVFSKSYCPFCVRAKNALKDLGVEFTAEELDKVDGGAETQAALLEMTKQRTVPNVFVNGKHLGGCDDTMAAIRSGKLAEMLKGEL